MIPPQTKAGDLITVPGSVKRRTGEITFIAAGRGSVFVCWKDTGRTTRMWPGPDARYEHRDLSELKVPPPRRARRRPTTDQEMPG